MALSDLSPAMQQQAREQLADVPCGTKSKYGNKPTTVDDIRFDSQAEARYYRRLVNQWHTGEILWFIRQVPFGLPGGVTYSCDFLVALPGGGIEVVDVKGYLTAISALKIKQVEAIYGIKVKLWPERKA